MRSRTNRSPLLIERYWEKIKLVCDKIEYNVITLWLITFSVGAKKAEQKLRDLELKHKVNNKVKRDITEAICAEMPCQMKNGDTIDYIITEKLNYFHAKRTCEELNMTLPVPQDTGCRAGKKQYQFLYIFLRVRNTHLSMPNLQPINRAHFYIYDEWLAVNQTLDKCAFLAFIKIWRGYDQNLRVTTLQRMKKKTHYLQTLVEAFWH